MKGESGSVYLYTLPLCITNMDNLVSIIIPVYNVEKYLKETLLSIQNQNYRNIQVIMIDDGSTDSSVEICKEFLVDRRFKLICQSNQGAPKARNNGFLNSKGEYIIFFDADDIMLENMIEKMVSTIEKNSSNLVISDFRLFNGTNILKKKSQNLKKVKNNYSLFFISPFPNNKLYRSSFLKNLNILFDDVKIGQDLNFFYKLIPHITSYEILDEVTSLYRLTPNSISRKYNDRILEIMTSFDYVYKYYKSINVDIQIYDYLNIAYLYHLIGQIYKLKYFEDDHLKKVVYKKLNSEILQMFKKNKKIFNIWFLKSLIKYSIFEIYYLIFCKNKERKK